MVDLKEKISLKQAILIFIVLVVSPAVRYLPISTVMEAKQASWLAPLVSLVFSFLFVLVWCKIFQKNDNSSFITIIQKIFGKKLGGVIGIIYFGWITMLIVYYVRMYAERLTSTVMPQVSIIVFISVMLLVVGYVLKSGIVVLSRMNELIFSFILVLFTLTVILIIPEMKIDNLFPITYKDIIPVFKASSTIMAIGGYITIIFMFADKIETKKEIKKLGIQLISFLVVWFTAIIIVPLSVFGASLTLKMPIPYFSSIIQISFFNTLERVESLVVIFWLITDFVLIATFVYAAMHVFEILFKTSKAKPITNIYLIGIFFMALSLGSSWVELETFSKQFVAPMNVALGYILPIVVFGVGKIRKKI